MRHRSINTLTLFFVVTIVWIGLSATAFSTTINVNTLSEEAESGDELCTLTEAINAANSDTAVDCEAGSGADTIELPAGIYVTAIVAEYAYPEINSTITIHGNGTNPEDTHLTRDSSDYVSFFSVAGSGNLTLQNIKLSDGLSDSSARGGAIANNGALTLEHTVFENNANTGRGGAIVNMGSALTISDSTFINNFSASATTGGGALYTAGAGNVDIANSTFVENLALAKDGGAIYVLGNSVTITDSSFSLNQATYFGGAIYVNTADLSITRSTLNDNIGYSGGGVYSATSTLNITQSALYENKAYHPATTVANNGGALYANDSAVTVSSSTLANNTTYNGAIANPPEGAGGAIFCFDAGGSLDLSNTTIVSNTSGTGGGISNFNCATTTIKNSIVENNTAPTLGANCSGVIASNGYNIIPDTTDCAISATDGDIFDDLSANLSDFFDTDVPASGHFPLNSTSPAIDSGDDCSATDQLGQARLGVCDRGAVEYVGADDDTDETDKPDTTDADSAVMDDDEDDSDTALNPSDTDSADDADDTTSDDGANNPDDQSGDPSGNPAGATVAASGCSLSPHSRGQNATGTAVLLALLLIAPFLRMRRSRTAG